MSKKTLYILIAAAVILIGGIAVAVASLYSNTKEKGPAVDPAQNCLETLPPCSGSSLPASSTRSPGNLSRD